LFLPCSNTRYQNPVIPVAASPPVRGVGQIVGRARKVHTMQEGRNGAVNESI